MRLSEIANKIPVEIVRDGEFESLGLMTYDNPRQLGYIEDAKYLPALVTKPNVACVIGTQDLASLVPQRIGLAVSEIPRKAFFEIHNYLAQNTDFYWKSFDTKIAGTARIHPTAYVAQKNVRIGQRCEVGPNASILENSILKSDVIIRAGSVIGTEGFEFERIGEETMRVVHAGGVSIHRRVEIQANCCVSKAVFGGFTKIGEDTKLDNLVHVAHGVVIGKRCLLAACAMIAGSVTIGDDVWVGPSASISSEVVIGDGALVTIGSVVTKDVAPGQRVTGNFAIDHDRFIEFLKTIR